MTTFSALPSTDVVGSAARRGGGQSGVDCPDGQGWELSFHCCFVTSGLVSPHMENNKVPLNPRQSPAFMALF